MLICAIVAVPGGGSGGGGTGGTGGGDAGGAEGGNGGGDGGERNTTVSRCATLGADVTVTPRRAVAAVVLAMATLRLDDAATAAAASGTAMMPLMSTEAVERARRRLEDAVTSSVTAETATDAVVARACLIVAACAVPSA